MNGGLNGIHEENNICNFNLKVNDQNENLLAFYGNCFECRGAKTNFRHEITEKVEHRCSL